MNINDIRDQHKAEREAFGKALMDALHDALPWGMEVDLGSGQKATLAALGKPYRAEIHAPGGSDVCDGTPPIGYEDWGFLFDWRLTNCDQDHIEVKVTISGGGGAV